MKGFLGLGLITLALLLGAAAHSAAPPILEFDHLWIMVTQNAPERSALEGAGFLISPLLNHHDGQGTASVTFEFENSYLELLWLGPTVPISPGLERAVEKFRQRTLWRTSGWCPIAIGFRRTASSSEALPFPIWTWTAEWMPKGTAMEMLTPRHIFGGAGALEPYGKIWRLGADYATVLHTDADLDLNGLAIPKGDYTLYADVDNGQWKLIVNKTLIDGARHIWGVGVSPDGIREGNTTNNPATELGRASLTMGKPSSPVETLKITLSGTGGAKGKLVVEWENVTASASFTVK